MQNPDGRLIVSAQADNARITRQRQGHAQVVFQEFREIISAVKALLRYRQVLAQKAAFSLGEGEPHSQRNVKANVLDGREQRFSFSDSAKVERQLRGGNQVDRHSRRSFLDDFLRIAEATAIDQLQGGTGRL